MVFKGLSLAKSARVVTKGRWSAVTGFVALAQTYIARYVTNLQEFSEDSKTLEMCALFEISAQKKAFDSAVTRTAARETQQQLQWMTADLHKFRLSRPGQ